MRNPTGKGSKSSKNLRASQAAVECIQFEGARFPRDIAAKAF